jgi:hypothetical protein
VWHGDLIEWEEHGSAAEASADVVLNRSLPDVIRRKAMLARLTAFAVESHPDDASQPAILARARLAEQLAQLQLYSVLSPLEKLFTRSERTVRIAVLSAMQTLFFKRSFITVRAGLRDPDRGVVDQAAKAVESLYFPRAFDHPCAHRAGIAGGKRQGQRASSARADRHGRGRRVHARRT